MTAIAGIILPDGHHVEPATVARMQTSLTPYGPDAQHSWIADSVMLLRTLLRTTPEDGLDQQPLFEAGPGIALVFDGRLDNRDELAEQLAITSADLRTMADVDVVYRACIRWGEDAPKYLLGDFAMACWDARKRILWLARDAMGHRPLYWHNRPSLFAFATMPKALFEVPGIPRVLCEERLAEHLALIPTTGQQTFFQNVFRVEAGQRVTLRDGKVTSHYFHRFNSDHEIHLRNDDDYVEAFREHLDRAVACRLRANGPIASQLSSGYDSSTVTALAAAQLQARGQRLVAYTSVPRSGFSGKVPTGRHADEGPGARALVARFSNIDHVEIRSDGIAPIDLLAQNIQVLDRAPLNPANLGWTTTLEHDAASRGVKCLLTGQAGNRTISYTGESYLPTLVGQGNFVRWWREASAIKHRHPDRQWLGLLAHSLGPYLPARLWVLLKRRGGHLRKLTDYSAIHPDFMKRMDIETRARRKGWDTSFRPYANGKQKRISEINRNDNGDYFAAVNATAGLEMRDPTCDLRLFEFCVAVPDHQYLRQGEDRWLLRRLMRNVLPPEITNARTGGLQAADWYEAAGASLPRMHEELDYLIAHGAAGAYLDLDMMKSLLEQWPQSGWDSGAVFTQYRLKLLRALSIGMFIRYVEAG